MKIEYPEESWIPRENYSPAASETTNFLLDPGEPNGTENWLWQVHGSWSLEKTVIYSLDHRRPCTG